MAMYAWPANLAKNEANYVSSLVDWPTIIGVGPTINDSLIDASTKLGLEITKRIKDRLSLPVPSELKPGQLYVPVDADTAARLDAHLEEINDKRFKKSLEIEQANREKRATELVPLVWTGWQRS
jgi:hypothetical protein